MHTKLFVFMIGLMTWATVSAYDNGPQVLACDYRFGKSEGTGQCLIVGSGISTGVSWLVFEVKKKRFRYTSSSENEIELINKSGETLKTYAVSNTEGQCRPGGRSADIYDFKNGDRVCLYWK